MNGRPDMPANAMEFMYVATPMPFPSWPRWAAAAPPGRARLAQRGRSGCCISQDQGLALFTQRSAAQQHATYFSSHRHQRGPGRLIQCCVVFNRFFTCLCLRNLFSENFIHCVLLSCLCSTINSRAGAVMHHRGNRIGEVVVPMRKTICAPGQRHTDVCT